jgi:hypothetical protein
LEIVEEYVQATLKDNFTVTGLHNRKDNHTHKIELPTYNHHDLHHYQGVEIMKGGSVRTTDSSNQTVTSGGLSTLEMDVKDIVRTDDLSK